jgi:hypothetical protein
MDAQPLKPDVMILIGLLLAWVSALLLFTPVFELMTSAPADVAKVGVATLGDLHDLCQSSLGGVGRLDDQEFRRGCSQVQTLLVFSYVGLIVGVGLLVGGGIMKRHWGWEMLWYVGVALFCFAVFLLYASYHIVAIPIPGGSAYQGRFF